MSFLCVCPEKSLEFGTDEKLHRSTKEEFIRGVLESVSFETPMKTIGTLPGGGMVIQHIKDIAPKIVVDNETSTIGALTGYIQNYAYLVKKYLQAELHLPVNVTLEAIRERIPISEVELLCMLYSQMGTGMLSKLRGQFAFCIYDATTVRVLTGRDCSGKIPLFQGKLSDNSLFITSEEKYPIDAHEVEEIPPGCYKYGWHAGLVKFANPESEVRHVADEASSAADAALAGLFCKTTDKAPQRRLSLDSGNAQHQEHNQKARNRLSLDSASDRNKTKADKQMWWRSQNTAPTATSTAAAATTSTTKTKRRRNRRLKKSTVQSLSQGEEVILSSKNPAENLLNELGGTIREDSSSVKMLMKLLEDSPCSLVVTDAKQDNQLVFVNKSFEDQTGYKSEEIIGKNCRFLQAPPGGCIVQSSGSKVLHKAIDEGQSGSVRLINYKKDGNPIFTECSIVPLRDSHGNITYYVGMHTFTPITDSDDHAAHDNDIKSSLLFRSRSCGDVASVLNVSPLTDKDALAI